MPYVPSILDAYTLSTHPINHQPTILCLKSVPTIHYCLVLHLATADSSVLLLHPSLMISYLLCLFDTSKAAQQTVQQADYIKQNTGAAQQH